MSELLARIFTLLTDVIMPQLQSIHASQTEQRLETDRLNRNIEEFRLEMQVRFAGLHAEIAACRQDFEDAMTTLREHDPEAPDATQTVVRKRTIH